MRTEENEFINDCLEVFKEEIIKAFLDDIKPMLEPPDFDSLTLMFNLWEIRIPNTIPDHFRLGLMSLGPRTGEWFKAAKILEDDLGPTFEFIEHVMKEVQIRFDNL